MDPIAARKRKLEDQQVERRARRAARLDDEESRVAAPELSDSAPPRPVPVAQRRLANFTLVVTVATALVLAAAVGVSALAPIVLAPQGLAGAWRDSPESVCLTWGVAGSLAALTLALLRWGVRAVRLARLAVQLSPTFTGRPVHVRWYRARSEGASVLRYRARGEEASVLQLLELGANRPFAACAPVFWWPLDWAWRTHRVWIQRLPGRETEHLMVDGLGRTAVVELRLLEPAASLE